MSSSDLRFSVNSACTFLPMSAICTSQSLRSSRRSMTFTRSTVATRAGAGAMRAEAPAW